MTSTESGGSGAGSTVKLMVFAEECPDCGGTGVVESTPVGAIPCPTCDWQRLRADLAQCQARLAKQDAVIQAARVLRDPYARGFSVALGEYAIWGAVQPIVDALAALDSSD